MKTAFTMILMALVSSAFSQKAEDLFRASETKIYWLGVDFSKVQLFGDFSQFGDAGTKSAVDIKTKYFPGWNQLIINEREKYDIGGMLRKENVLYTIDMITEVNSNTPTEEMESNNIPKKFLAGDIQNFVKGYRPEAKDGIGIVLLAETLNKAATEAWFHFVAIDLSSNQVLFSERMQGIPGGIGLRNYWAGSIYDIIKQIKKTKYKEWKSKFSRS